MLKNGVKGFQSTCPILLLMASENDNYTPPYARLGAAYPFGGLLVFGIGISTLLVSSDTYFNATTYTIAISAIAHPWEP